VLGDRGVVVGCDIHALAEKRIGSSYEWLDMSPPVFDCRDYGMFGFLADVRNYYAVPPIVPRRGLPGDLSSKAANYAESWGDDGHSHSWLSVQELSEFDYDAPMVDRRVRRQIGPNIWSGGYTGSVEEGKLTTYREFLGRRFFNDLNRLKVVGASRVVFWFDN
jgi:hypothetical protein